MTRGKSTGFTALEIVLALTISAMVALAILGVSTALSSAYAHSQDFYETVQAGRNGMMRIQRMLREAKLVTAKTDTSLVLWAEDANGDDMIDLTEMRLLVYDPSTFEVLKVQVTLPEGLPDDVADLIDADVSLESAVNYSTVMSFMSSPYAVSTVIATDVQEFHVRARTEPPLTDLVKIDMKIADGDRSLHLRSAVTLRADRTDYVGTYQGEYMLMYPDREYSNPYVNGGP